MSDLQSTEPFPHVTSVINNLKFIDAQAIIDGLVSAGGLSESDLAWLEGRRLICIVGQAAQSLLDGKKAMQSKSYDRAMECFQQVSILIEPHYQALKLDSNLAAQMAAEMQSMLDGRSFRDLPQLNNDRNDILQAVNGMLPESIGRSALVALLDAHFHVKLVEMYLKSDKADGDLSHITELLKNKQCEEALTEIEMERLRCPGDAVAHEQLDYAEKAARSILVITKYREGDQHFQSGETEKGLSLYREIVALMKGRYVIFGLNEAGLDGVLGDFEGKVASGAIASYEDMMEFRSSYMELLKQRFAGSTDFETIVMVLDAHIALTFYARLHSATNGRAPKSKPQRKKKGILRAFLTGGLLGVLFRR